MRNIVKKSIISQRGFSLLETVVALGILVVGIGGAVGLVSQSLANISAIKNKAIAANLAQEGIEVVRNFRDENWLKDCDWRTGGSCGSGQAGIDLNVDGDYRVQYNGTSLIAYAVTPLQLNSSGYYGYNGQFSFSGGQDTVFKRKISISTISVNQIKVVATIDWAERGGTRSMVIEDRLYNWK